MQKFLGFLKIFILLLCAILAYFSYTFWSIWQENKQAEVVDMTLSESSLSMGETFKVTASFKVPWHREMNVDKRVTLPEGMRVLPETLSVRKSDLNMNGYRYWSCQFEAIALLPGDYENKPVDFSMKADRNREQRSLQHKLPKLTVTKPELQLIELKSRSEKLDSSIMRQKPSTPVETIAASTWDSLNYPVLIAVFSVLLVILILRRPKKQLSPWEEAFKKLTVLSAKQNESLESFFVSLTDIIKVYSSRRFAFNANASSSEEFMEKLSENSGLKNQQRDSLKAMLEEADAVKFAQKSFHQDIKERSVEKAREFINSTRPEEEAEK